MKNFCLLLAAVLMIVGISLPAFAADEDPVEPSDSEVVTVEETTDPETVPEDGTTTDDGTTEGDTTTEDGTTDDTVSGDNESTGDSSNSDDVPVIQFSGSTTVKDLDDSVSYESVLVPFSVTPDVSYDDFSPLSTQVGWLLACEGVFPASIFDSFDFLLISQDPSSGIVVDRASEAGYFTMGEVVPLSEHGFSCDGLVFQVLDLPMVAVVFEEFSLDPSLPAYSPGLYFFSVAISDSAYDYTYVSSFTSFSYEVEESVVVNDSSPLMQAIESIFGEYSPRTYSVTTYLDDGTEIQSTEIVPGLAGLDWNWLAGVGLFVLALYCIFRMIGGVFRWK